MELCAAQTACGPITDKNDGKPIVEVFSLDEMIGPFDQSTYSFPNLFTELTDMWKINVLLYPLAEARRLAGEKVIQEDRVFMTPLSYKQLVDIIEEHGEKISKTETKVSKNLYRDILEAAHEFRILGPSRELSLSMEVVDLVEKADDANLVYMISVDHSAKRVTICFRGSIHSSDWATGYELYMKDAPNPIKKHSSQKSTIKIHHRFYKALFKPSMRESDVPEGEGWTQYREILQDHVQPILRKNPGYKLYVTGYSYGAALATLFAFQASSETDDKVPKPVSLVSIGGPYVGDDSFRSAHQLLEGLGKLRHVRLTNHKDIVPIVPKISWRWNVLDMKSHVGTLFKHVGVNVRLYEGDVPFELSYPRVRTGIFSTALDEMTRAWEQTLLANLSLNPVDYFLWPNHSLGEYGKRVHASEKSLSILQLNELYARHDIVGRLVPQI